MPADPSMPRQMPPAVERALREKLGWRNRPNPVDIYNAVRDGLVEAQAASGGGRPLDPQQADSDDFRDV
jgi:hypothetical protein